MKKLIGSFFLILLAATIFTLFSPAAEASAKNNNNNKDIWGDWISGWENWDSWQDWENWWDWEDTLDEASDYLVLVGQPNGSYIAYDDLAFVTGGNSVMVKAKPLATALGMTYKTFTGNKKKKGLSLTLGQDNNVYARNSKTYYFFDYNPATRQTSTRKLTAAYKQIVHENYNAVHCASLSTLVNYQYYDTSGTSDYRKLGYCGVVVYNRYAAITQLPALSNVANFSGYIAINDPNNNNNNNNNNNQNTFNATINPSVVTDPSYTDIKYVDASYIVCQDSRTHVLDLANLQATYQSYGLPYGGAYGSGNSDNSITIQGYDKYGNLVGEIKTTGGTSFIFSFPSAVKMKLIGTLKNLVMDFTPVTPILVTSNTKYAFNQISWVYQTNGYARQYFVVADHMRFTTENVTSPYTVFRRFLREKTYSNPDNADSYQRICAVFKSPYYELSSGNCYVNFQKTDSTTTGKINNSLVVFADTGSYPLAADFESKLVSMIATLKNTGLNTYYSSTNFNNQLVMKLPSNTANTAYDYIYVDGSYLNLDNHFDYYFMLHEMVHFYETTSKHYGFRFAAWTDGNATNLAKKTMDALNVNHKDSNGKDYIDTMYKTDFSFLTQNDKNNFEAYYLNATGWNATVIGYHFTDFIQDLYGSDIVYKIMEKFYAANIPHNNSRTSDYDKKFVDCIKSATTNDIFKLFVDLHVTKNNWD